MQSILSPTLQSLVMRLILGSGFRGGKKARQIGVPPQYGGREPCARRSMPGMMLSC